ncbi:MAG: hypothetical protein KatS3mg105_0552 [Gemmatales bacterium]|nr:MAG: hypothetical protein KatS3mg105_0552 [Gemmatales bacterium]
MSTAADVTPVRTARAVSLPASGRPAKAWLMNPWCDLFFLANCAWPVIVLAVYLAGKGSSFHVNLSIAFLYFLSTPHRYITLALVFLDRDRFIEQPRTFVGIAMVVCLVVACFWLSLTTIALLLAIDYVWNSWHFAAQHSGISRIYGRSSRPDIVTNGMVEKVVLRTFILYAIFRLASIPVHKLYGSEVDAGIWLRWLQDVMASAQMLDLPMLALPVFLLVRELVNFRPSMVGRLAYLLSICGAYSALLVAVHIHNMHSSSPEWTNLVAGIAMAISIIHSVEYLAIVSWAVKKRHGNRESGLFAYLVPRWTTALVIFVCTLGLSATLLTLHFFHTFAMVTIIASWLHYAYDGIIWKAPRRPQPA